MKHLILIFICSVSAEIITRSNYISLLNSLIEVSRKAIYIILSKKISDTWKENIIPYYSIKMIKVSLQMLLIFLLIFSFFIVADNLLSGFLSFTFSTKGIIESMLIALCYVFFKKLIYK